MGRISYSQLSMFSECPLRWKLNYIDDVSVREPSIHLLFGTAMHEVIQTWLEVMYHDSVKNANKLNLEQRLHDKMMEQFQKDKEAYGKNPCTLEQLRELFQDGVDILDFVNLFEAMRLRYPEESFNMNMSLGNFIFRYALDKRPILLGDPVTSAYKQFQDSREDVYFIHK